MPDRQATVVIAGAAETAELGVLPTTSMLDLHAESALRALADAGVRRTEVDGLATARPSPVEVAHHLGLQPRWIDGTEVGGCSFMSHVRHAVGAIRSRQADLVLITHGQSGRSRVGEPTRPVNPSSAAGQFEYPFGATRPYSIFTLPALKFLLDRGLDQTALAEVVVAQRQWAAPNPRAMRRDKVGVEEVLASPEIAWPFTRDMCCVVSDGGGALILTSEERAGDLRRSASPVYVLGTGEATAAPLVAQMGDLTRFAPFRAAASAAMAEANLRPNEINHVMIYDAFAHLPLYGLEDLGFVGHGESAGFIADGHTAPGGRLPLNTNGGGLNYTHTGMYGMFAIQEAVRQLRFEACVQVPNVQTSLVQGVGLFFGAAATLVLSNTAVS